jgi:hypothetical protein
MRMAPGQARLGFLPRGHGRALLALRALGDPGLLELGDQHTASATRTCPVAVAAIGVAFRFGPECISICLNDFARPPWCGNYTIAPEKRGIGPESANAMWRSAWLRGLLSLASV